MSEFQRFQANADSLVRQTEINEWESNKKLETLFLLQLSCVGLMLLCIAGYAASNGLISYIYVGYLGIVMAAFWIYLAVTKSMKRGNRDDRTWNQKKFPSAEASAAEPIIGADLVRQRAEELLGTRDSSSAQ